MTEKPDDKTWYEYIFADEKGDGEREERWAEFGETMAAEVRSALEASGLDESRYRVEAGHRPSVEADGWRMTEKGEVVRLRAALREEDIGDGSVGVYGTPRDSEGEIAELPPEHAPVNVDYSVFVNLERNQEAIDGGAAAAKDGMG